MPIQRYGNGKFSWNHRMMQARGLGDARPLLLENKDLERFFGHHTCPMPRGPTRRAKHGIHSLPVFSAVVGKISALHFEDGIF
jgi:hypothetical protein